MSFRALVVESAKKCGAIRQRMPRSRVSCPVHGSGGTLLTLANCLSTTVSITLSTIPVEAPDCHSGVGWPSLGHVAIYPHESGTAPHFLALPYRLGGLRLRWFVQAVAPPARLPAQCDSQTDGVLGYRVAVVVLPLHALNANLHLRAELPYRADPVTNPVVAPVFE